MATEDRKTLILWVFECVQDTIDLLEKKYPNEDRPRKAFEMCQKWARGEMKMAVAKRAILDCHAVSKEIDDIVYSSLCHAIGQGVSTVHVKTHAIGLPFYELSAIVFANPNNYEELLTEKINYYCDTLLKIKNEDLTKYSWAPFLEKE